MPKIAISEFRGLLPKVDRRNLPAGFASVAQNIRFDAGDLSPIRAGISSALTDTTDTGTLYYHRNTQESLVGEKYLAFGSALDVRFARSPSPDDAFHRLYWHIYDPGSPSNPINGLRAIKTPITNPSPNGLAVAGTPAQFRPFSGYRVGVPAPTVAPVVSDVTALAELVGVIGLSPTSTLTVTSATVPFKSGEQVRIKIDPSLPKGDEEATGPVPPGDPEAPEVDSTVGRLWTLDGRTGRVANIGAAGDTFDIIGVSGTGLGQTELTAEEKAAVTIERFLTDQDMESRAYVFTYVTEFGEEGPPSPPSNIIDVPMTAASVEVQMSGVTQSYADEGGDRAYVNRIRIYRTASGERARYLFVAETSAPGAMEGNWSKTVTEDVPALDLGEPLASEQWYPPPVGMKGIHLMPNGFLVGWKGNTLYFSEPYLPHAWNPDYKRTIDNDILNVESFGNTLVIGTEGRPYLATGTDPASMSIRKLPAFAPLANPKAMVDAGTGVLYPSESGLYLVSASGAQNITEQHFDKKTWASTVGQLERGVFFDNRIIFFSRGADPLVIDMNGGKADISRLTGVDAAAAAVAGNALIFVVRDGASYGRLREFKIDGNAFVTGFWTSGLLTMPKACNLAVLQVFATGYHQTTKPLRIILSYANLDETGQPDLADMDALDAIEVAGPEPVRLPSHYLSREFMIGIETTHRVQSVIFATSMDELKA